MDIKTLALVGGICVLFTGTLVQGKPSLTDIFTRLTRSDPLHDECAAAPDDRQECGRRASAIGKWECKSRGCCWDDTDRLERGTIRCFLAARMLTQECDIDYKDKDDCGFYEMTEAECLVKGCCWRPSPLPNDPECYKKVAGIPFRLIQYGAESTQQGRVEVFYEQSWGTVCDDGFGKEEANVICKQMGYASGIPKNEAYFGEGRGNIWLDELNCDGTERSLDKCQHARWGQHDCSHYEDAGVTCYQDGEEPEPEPENSGYIYYNDGDDYWEEVEYMSRLKHKPPKKKTD